MTDSPIEKPKSRKKGCLIGCLGLILLFFGFGIFSIYISTPQMGGDKNRIVDDIYRYHLRYGKWPSNVEELKIKIPDYKFEGRYDYFHNDELFVVRYSGTGMIGDDFGEFYRSDTKEWKDLYTNRKELYDLEEKLQRYGTD